MKCLWISLCFVLLACIYAGEAHNTKVVCYYGSWSTYRPGRGKCPVEAIDSTLCTHLIYTFVGLNKDGSIHVLDPWCDLHDGLNGYAKFNALKEQNSELKTILAMGGWNELATQNLYTLVFNNPKLRSVFVKNVVDFVLKYQFDGFDFDWEYPNQRGGKPEDVQSFTDTLRELKEAFEPHNLLLTTAVAAAKKSASVSYQIKKISQYVDIINLMTYDLHGAFIDEETHRMEPTGFNAPLYPRHNDPTPDLTVDSCVKYWLESGADRSKIVLGIPLYGRNFKLSKIGDTEPGSVAVAPGNAGPYSKQAGSLNYNEILEIKKTYKQFWDQNSHVPYMVNGNQWVSYENETSVQVKTRYALKNNLGGVMVWSIDADDIVGFSGKKYPLLQAINEMISFVNDKTSPAPSTSTSPSQTSEESTTNTPKYSEETVSSTSPSEEVDTTGTTEDFTSTTESTTAAVGSKCTEVGYMRDVDDCTIFYYCLSLGPNQFQKNKFTCPAGLVYNVVTGVCDWKTNVPECM